MQEEAGSGIPPTGSEEPSSPLDLDPERMRRLGHAVVDRVVERWTRLEHLPVNGPATREQMEARLREPLPSVGSGIEEVLERFWHDVEPFAGRIDHPRFFAFIPSSPTFASVLGDWLAAGCNFFQGTWIESAGPSQVEIVVLDWFKRWFDFPPGAAGLLTSGGSAANLLGLAVAREAMLGGLPGEGVAYCSDQTHTAVDRALHLLGFPRERLRRLPSTPEGTLDPAVTERAVAEDRGRGLRPFCVVGNAGTTNRGAVDPVEDLADVCRREGLWLHIDAAYGGFARLTRRGRDRLRGLSAAHSLVLDPHKWLYVGYEAGCVLVRDGSLLPRTFSERPEYLQDTQTGPGEVNFADYGLQLTRRARALKLWVSLLAHGTDAMVGAIDRAQDLAEFAEALVGADSTLEVSAPASLGITCFRYVGSPRLPEPRLERVNENVVKRIQADGRFMLSSTRLDGRYVMRLCPMNYRSSEQDVRALLDEVRRVARDVAERGLDYR